MSVDRPSLVMANIQPGRGDWTTNLRFKTRRKHVEKYAESGREVRRGSDRSNLFDDGGMGARFERRLVCVNQHHGVALGNSIADGQAVAHWAGGSGHFSGRPSRRWHG